MPPSPPPHGQAIAQEASGANWTALLGLAEAHGVTQVLAAAAQKLTNEIVPADIRAELADRQRAQLFFTLRISAELFRLAERCAAQNIALAVVKGPALAAQGYGDAG